MTLTRLRAPQSGWKEVLNDTIKHQSIIRVVIDSVTRGFIAFKAIIEKPLPIETALMVVLGDVLCPDL